jgi:hypothetical protein
MTEISDILDLLFSRRIIVFGGEFGRSKTLSMTAYSYLSFVYNNISNYVTNTPMNFGRVQQHITMKPLLTTAEFDLEYQDTIFNIDEIQENLDARDFMSPKIKYLTHWAKDLRKHNCQIIGTLQYFDFLELRAAEMLQVIIIPSFVNTYHMNEKKDILKRLENHDFTVCWYIIDRKVNKEYTMELNLWPYINMYWTKYVPSALIVNHKDYMFYMKHQKGEKKYDFYVEDIATQLKFNLANFNAGLQHLGVKPVSIKTVAAPGINLDSIMASA